MALHRAKDSILSLPEFAEQQSKASDTGSVASSTDGHPLLEPQKEQQVDIQQYQSLPDDDDDDDDETTSLPAEDDSCVLLVDPTENPEEYVPYWKPGGEFENYLSVEPLDPKWQREKANRGKKKMGCFSLPFCNLNNSQANGDNDYDDDDDDAGPEVVDANLVINRLIRSNSTDSQEGILKKSSMYMQTILGINQTERLAFQPTSYHDEYHQKNGQVKKVRFAPLKQVIRISPTRLMTQDEFEDYWWQIRDFETFKSSISLLTRPQEQEAACRSILANGSPRKSVTEKISTGISNWWHKYGDSRRGLEKVASAVVAKQIMASYKEATRMVLAEQRHQRYMHQPDQEKLARVYHEYTGWSSDLALAAAASDEDAVKTNFDDSKRKTREYFLLKQLYKNEMKVHKHMPQFMLPVGFKPEGYLDEQWEQSTTSSSDTRKPSSDNTRQWNWPIWRRAG